MIAALALSLALFQEPVYAGVDLRARNLPVRQALAQLGRQMNGDTFDVPATIKGNVNAVFINLPYQSAVHRVLAQVGAGCKGVLGTRVIGANNKPIGHKVIEMGRIETPVTLQGTFEIRTALRELFKQVGRSYVINGNLQGQVTSDSENEPFSSVLVKVLNQVSATYVMDGDIFDVRGTAQRVSAEMLGQTINRFTSTKERRWAALGRLARMGGMSLEIDPMVDVDSRVSIDMTSTPFSLLLSELAGPKAVVDTESGICRIRVAMK